MTDETAFTFREVSRTPRALSRERAEELLRTCTHGVLSVQGDGGYPYGVPVNYGYVDGKIYIHGTVRQSHRNDAVQRCDKVCFTVVARADMNAPGLMCEYESAIVFGRARLVEDHDERMEAMRKMMEGIAPEYTEHAMEDCGRKPRGYSMLVITPEHITGKAGR